MRASALVTGQLAALHLQRAREGGGWDAYLAARHTRPEVVNVQQPDFFRAVDSLLEAVPHLTEYNIGHSIVSRALFTGVDEAVREMRARMNG